MLIVAGGAYYHFQLSGHFETFKTGAMERPTVKANYYVENESLTIEITEGNFTSKSNFVALKNGSRSYPKAAPDNNFVLKEGEKTKKTYIWASNAIHHVPWRMEDLPLKEGSQVTVVEDGVDSDNDGQKGIENGDKVSVTSYNDGNYALVYTFVIYNSTAICTLTGNAEEYQEYDVNCYE